MRNRFADALVRLAREDPTIYIVVADISPAGPIAEFRSEFPDRFINVGVAEQAMIGICAGLALRGMKPFAYTIATFALYRPFEFIRDDLAYQNLPVTVVGIGGGVVYSTLGGTHHAQEDIAIASAIPNMTVVAPCDRAEVESATEVIAAREGGGPVYFRLGKAGEGDITQAVGLPFELGKIRYFAQGNGDIALLSYGLMMHKTLEIASVLTDRGRSVTVVSSPTLKPLDRAGIVDVICSHRQVVVIEEHAPQGGLASQVKQIAWDSRSECDLRVYTLQDRFIHCYGSHDDLLEAHGLSIRHILSDIS